MVFKYDVSDKLEMILKKLYKKNRKQYRVILKKIEQIASCSKEGIIHFKNLRYDLKDKKRVHIDKHFVLVFKVDIKKNFILFLDFDHHDNIYKK